MSTFRLLSMLLAAALVNGLCTVPHHASATQPPGDKRDDSIAELKKRVAKLEAEVAQLRKALLQAGVGQPDAATEIKNLSEMGKLRAADLLQRTQNTHALLREVMNGKLAGQALQNKINDLNNDLVTLWFKVAGYGLGRDPYLDDIQVSTSGFGRPKPAPNHGIPGPYVAIGLPRLHEHFLEAAGVKGEDAKRKSTEFKKLVQAYSNPAVYQHRDFNERAYNDYRMGKGILTPQFGKDLKALDQWLTDLETVLGTVPAYFTKAP